MCIHHGLVTILMRIDKGIVLVWAGSNLFNDILSIPAKPLRSVRLNESVHSSSVEALGQDF